MERGRVISRKRFARRGKDTNCREGNCQATKKKEGSRKTLGTTSERTKIPAKGEPRHLGEGKRRTELTAKSDKDGSRGTRRTQKSDCQKGPQIR